MSRVLVAYASKHGATEEIAQAIAEELRGRGHSADCTCAEDVNGVGSYDAVVLGSAVYMGRWRPAARRLVKREAGVLAERPLWLFSSGPCGQPDPSWKAPPGIEKRASRLRARAHVVLGGRMPVEPSNFIERSMVAKCPRELRDLRDWDVIRAWAGGIADELAGGRAASA
jgi:menaquinone-dependent protoporphyrinogen oxidase